MYRPFSILLIVFFVAVVFMDHVIAADNCAPTIKKRTFTSNQGHRGGCESDAYRFLPENSLVCLEAGLVGLNGNPPLQCNPDFKYLEFDVRETKDQQLVIYHGGRGGKIFKGKHATAPYECENIKIFDSFDTPKNKNQVTIKDLKAEDIKKLYLGGEYGQKIPIFQEYFQKIDALGLDAKLMVEIKDVSCDLNALPQTPAKVLIHRVWQHEQRRKQKNPDNDLSFEKQQVGFLVYKGRINRLGGDDCLECWCKALKNTNLRIYETGKHRIMREVLNACQ